MRRLPMGRASLDAFPAALRRGVLLAILDRGAGEREREDYRRRVGVLGAYQRQQIIKPAFRFVVPFDFVNVVYVDGSPDLPEYCRRFHCVSFS